MSRDRRWRLDRQSVGQFAGPEESPPHPGREHQGHERNQQNQGLPVLEQPKCAPGSVNHHVRVPPERRASQDTLSPCAANAVTLFYSIYQSSARALWVVIRVRPSLVSIMRNPRIARTKTSIEALRARIVPPARKFLLGLGRLPHEPAARGPRKGWMRARQRTKMRVRCLEPSGRPAFVANPPADRARQAVASGLRYRLPGKSQWHSLRGRAGNAAEGPGEVRVRR